MNYGLFSGDKFDAIYGERYSPPYWLYTVTPRNYNEPIYSTTLDFAEPPLDFLGPYYPVDIGTILEVFILDKRVLVTGVQISVLETADIRLKVCTRSGVPFDVIDCSIPGEYVFLPFGGIMVGPTNISDHSFVVEEPDYIGFVVLDNPEEINNLKINISVVVSDDFPLDSKTNSSKD